ncbi:MAG: ATP-dependent metallopeptidase FtsH/Yme1/Tma family protein, partial [Methylobacter sp.]
MMKNIILWVVIAVVLMSVFNNFGPQNDRSDSSMSYSQFIESVKAGQIQQVMIEDNIIKGKMQGGQIFKTYAPS